MAGLKSTKRSYTLVLTAALSALLVMLAVLQYRWLGQVSVGERQVLQTSLRNRAIDFQQAFNRELSRARSTLQIEPDVLRNQAGGQLAERSERWNASAPYPGLVANLFVAESTDGEQTRLLRFNKENRQLEATDWSTSFPDTRWASPSESQAGIHEEGIPALVQPVVARESRETAAGFVIIALDLDYIRQVFIPALAKSHFTDNGIIDYDLALVNRNKPNTVVYDTHGVSADQPSSRPPNEEAATILNLRVCTIAEVYEHEPERKSELLALNVDARLRREMERKHELELKRELSRNHIPEGSVVFATARHRFLGPTVGQLMESQERESWQMEVRYLPGTLDATVARGRLRNIAVSFGILSLLALSIIMISINARRAQRLARQQMDFVAGVSHEFRTPLSVIHAISENLADGLITDPQQIEQCGMVVRNDVRRLSGMVEQVLELAGAYRGKALYQPCPVNFSNIVDQVLASCPASGLDRDWQVEKDIEPGLPDVIADPTALASAVRNIVDNAIKYGGGHRWIGIKAHSQTSDQSEKIEIIIEDKGIGISQSDLPHIFEPFYRSREVRSAQIHGNGLGLSLVKNIIEAHGGTISVTSAPGKGSSFTLNLPAAARQHPASEMT